jgi:hypothetical protein
MGCTFALPYGWDTLDQRIKGIHLRTALPLYVLGIIIVVTLRSGISIPLLSPLANPLLAEREKTHQLRAMMDWVLRSEYKHYEVLLHREKQSPSFDPTGAIRRNNIPPTGQMYVDLYMKMMRPDLRQDADLPHQLRFTFGDDQIEHMQLLKAFEGEFAGKAMVYCAE